MLAINISHLKLLLKNVAENDIDGYTFTLLNNEAIQQMIPTVGLP